MSGTKLSAFLSISAVALLLFSACSVGFAADTGLTSTAANSGSGIDCGIAGLCVYTDPSCTTQYAVSGSFCGAEFKASVDRVDPNDANSTLKFTTAAINNETINSTALYLKSTASGTVGMTYSASYTTQNHIMDFNALDAYVRAAGSSDEPVAIGSINVAAGQVYELYIHGTAASKVISGITDDGSKDYAGMLENAGWTMPVFTCTLSLTDTHSSAVNTGNSFRFTVESDIKEIIEEIEETIDNPNAEITQGDPITEGGTEYQTGNVTYGDGTNAIKGTISESDGYSLTVPDGVHFVLKVVVQRNNDGNKNATSLTLKVTIGNSYYSGTITSNGNSVGNYYVGLGTGSSLNIVRDGFSSAARNPFYSSDTGVPIKVWGTDGTQDGSGNGTVTMTLIFLDN